MDEFTIMFRKSTQANHIRKASDEVSFISTTSVDSNEKNDTKEKINEENDLYKRTLGSVFLGLFYALASGIFFSLCSTAVKSLDTVDSLQLSIYQYIGTWVFSMPMVVLSSENPFGPNRTCRNWILLCGVFDAITIYLVFLSFHNLPLADASVITCTVPVFVTITVRIFLKERYGKAQIGAMVISVLGIALVSKIPLVLTHGAHAYTKENIIGLIAALSSVATETSVYVIVRKLHEVDAFVILFNFGWIGTMVTVLMTASFGNFSFASCEKQWMVLGIGGFGFLYQLTFAKALELEHAGIASMVMAVGEVILAFVLDTIVFNNHPDAYVIGGTILVVSSIIIVSLKKWFDELPNQHPFKMKISQFTR